MPRACPVEPHARCYITHQKPIQMPRACPVEPHAHCYITHQKPIQMPRACPVEPHVRGYSSCERETSTAQGRGIQARFFSWCVADIVTLHGTSPWHLYKLVASFRHCKP